MRLAILLALAACAARPQLREPPPTDTPWCFRGVLVVSKQEQVAMACFSTAVTCGLAQRKALSIGGLAGIKEVSVCRAAK